MYMLAEYNASNKLQRLEIKFKYSLEIRSNVSTVSATLVQRLFNYLSKFINFQCFHIIA